MSSSFNWDDFQDAPSGQSNQAQGGGSFNWDQFQDEPSMAEQAVTKAGRGAMMLGKGMVQRAVMPFDVGAIGAKHIAEAGQPQITRERLFEDVEQMQEQKQTGVWSPQDEQRLQDTLDLIKNPKKAEQYYKEAPALDSGSLIEKGFEQIGIDAKPQDIAEMALNWTGIIKNPTKAAQLLKNPSLLAKDPRMILKIAKDLAPKGSELARGGGAALLMEGAMQAELGPIGTLAAGIIGDYLGGGVAGVAKGIPKFAKAPIKTTKEALAKGAAKFTTKDKLDLQKELIRDFRNAGIQADLGTLTDSNLMKGMQSALSQSRFTGKALDNFRAQLREDIVGQYKQFANKIGEERFASQQEAGEALVQKSKEIRDLDKAGHTEAYAAAAKEAEGADAIVLPRKLGDSIKNLEKKLAPGKIKSTEQKAVLNYLNELKGDIFDESGNIKASRVDALINNKTALNDIINYEVQGGTKQLLKGIVKELDDAIGEYGAINPKFKKSLAEANKKFGEHARTFRNKDIDAIIRGENPMTLMNKMNTPQGIRRIGDVLNKTKEGRELFGQLKRFKMEELIGKKMVDSVTEQMKLGTFTNLLNKGRTRELVKEMMSPAAFKRFERLAHMTGKLAESAQKFFNASKSGATSGDMIWGGLIANDLSHLFAGNPWPAVKAGAKIIAPRQLAKLITNPEFLQMVEDAILASEKNSVPLMQRAAANLKNRFFPNQKGPMEARNISPQVNPQAGGTGPHSPAASSNASISPSSLPTETMRNRVPSSNIPSSTTVPGGQRSSLPLGSIDPSNNKIILQSYDNIQQLTKRASELKNKLNSELNDLITGIKGAEIYEQGANIKKAGSIEKKLQRGSHKPNQIGDYIRGRVVVDNEKGLNKVLERLEEKNPVEIDDFLHKPKAEWGYRAVHSQIPINGMTAEVQIVPRQMSKIQPWMHKYYKKWQQVPSEKRKKIPEYEADLKKVRTVVDRHYEAFKKGKSPLRD